MQLSQAEWRIMTCLWQGGPASVRELLERLGPKAPWAYTTVKTMLTRLSEKGAVKESMLGNASVYAAAVTQRAARKTAVRSLVERAFDGTYGAFIHHLVADEKLSAKDKERLRKMLDESADREGRGKEGRS